MVIKDDASVLQFRQVDWLGDSRKTVKGWPKKVRSDVGDDLAVVQLGQYPDGCEPLSDVGKDVHAIRVRVGKEQYRVLWIAKLSDVIYVLHAFHKKSKSGIATPDEEKKIASDRLKRLRETLLLDSKTSQRS